MYKVSPPNYSYVWIMLLIGCILACILMAFASSAEQKIDDLRPRVRTCCWQMTKDWCIECTKFADPNDFQYYKEVYEASK